MFKGCKKLTVQNTICTGVESTDTGSSERTPNVYFSLTDYTVTLILVDHFLNDQQHLQRMNERSVMTG